ncbi:ABC transporter ATP-binding protein [Lactobacillus sp. DCY120]|uniref:ABC transporter ATP-binding protein n=1 Tax=Bombilactobacillus apium TaxID=2675299 RepID=A0A850QYV2_9LACO|nr:ATP-binding cassette domain-containing protein [Bombilactobacillus apium]NVY95919.1 ABC transporter ATP-binding protein [Bombilactobacillus apium]
MIIQTSNLTKVYQTEIAVDHIDLKIKKGSLTALLGPNGAGKTTIISMLTGLLKPTVGIIKMKAETKISMVFQQSILDNDLTVRENLLIRNKLYKKSNVNYIDTLIDQVGLAQFIDRKYRQLSGGQRRRVDIARALLNQPDVIFLDEPTAGLDIQTRSAIWNLLYSFQHNNNLTIILTTHYLEEADNADKVYIIDRGKVIASGSATEIKAQNSNNKLTIVSEHADYLMKLIPGEINHTQFNHKIVCFPADSDEALTLLLKFRIYVKTFTYQDGTMDDAFLSLTGRKMR